MTTNKDLIETIIRETPSLYALKHYTIRGKPITFDIQSYNDKRARGHRPWQKGIIDDQHEDKVVRKSRQLGLSEMGCLELLHFIDTKPNVKTMFTFPRSRQVSDFVKTRLNPVLDSNPYFSEILDQQMNSLEVKKIRESFMLFRSAWGSALGEGADIDMLAFDEYDRMTEGIEFAFQESMKSSAFGWLRRWSTPTIPGRGVDALFQKSDQRFWTHKCQHCNHWQVLDFVDNIIQLNPNGVNIMTDEIEDGTFDFVCAKCKKSLDRWYSGEWVAKYPSRSGVRGYHISQMDAVWISADDVKRRELTYTSKQLFHNYVIGMPFASEGLLITEDDILASTRLEAPVTGRRDYAKIVVGIDWNKVNYAAVIGIKENGQTDLIKVFSFEDNPNKPLDAVSMLAASLYPFDPDLIVADEGYGADRNSYLMQLFKGRTWACRYQTYKGKSKPIDSWNETARLVTVDKTLKVQRMLHMIKARGLGFWKMDDDMLLVLKHLKNTRIMVEEENGIVYEVATRVGDDHTAAALNYACIAAEKIKNPYQPVQEFNFDFL